jgi:flagellar protein FlbD
VTPETPRTDFAVILVTRLNGPEFALNPDLVERAESTPDTVVTLVDGTKYVIAESVDELIRLVRLYRAGVLADAQRLSEAPVEPVPVREAVRERGANVVPLHPRER